MRRVAICGKAASTFDEIPVDDPSWEIWSLIVVPLKNTKRFFEMHKKEMWKGYHNPKRVRGLLLAAAEMGVPVYMWRKYPEVKTAVRYPIEDVRDKVPLRQFYKKDYVTSSAAWMLALAITEGVDEIGIWGIDMTADEEYVLQRANFEWLIGYAQGKGIKVHIPAKSALCKTDKVYGLEWRPGMEKELAELAKTIRKVRGRLEANPSPELQQQLNELITMKNYQMTRHYGGRVLDGALDGD